MLPLQRFWGGNGPREYVYPHIKLLFAHTAVGSPNRRSSSCTNPYEDRNLLESSNGVYFLFFRYIVTHGKTFSSLFRKKLHVLMYVNHDVLVNHTSRVLVVSAYLSPR